ncbi:MAG: hypothetical protein BGP20_10455 [Thiobacillus sp. 63-78]|nr:MAG: hypothetical protein BGP20_10455 [Thiobacillus sp. 63-78]
MVHFFRCDATHFKPYSEQSWMVRVMASLGVGVVALLWPGLTMVVMVILRVALAFRSRPLQA